MGSHWVLSRGVTQSGSIKRLTDIKRQRDKLIKEGKYTPPPHHLGKEDPRP